MLTPGSSATRSFGRACLKANCWPATVMVSEGPSDKQTNCAGTCTSSPSRLAAQAPWGVMVQPRLRAMAAAMGERAGQARHTYAEELAREEKPREEDDPPRALLRESATRDRGRPGCADGGLQPRCIGFHCPGGRGRPDSGSVESTAKKRLVPNWDIGILQACGSLS